jgi:hypothetical protein
MECPHCRQEIPAKKCPHCGRDIPLESRYCMFCGSEIEDSVEELSENDNGFDLDNRILCPDGTCTGIIINGRCTECGRPFKGKK